MQQRLINAIPEVFGSAISSYIGRSYIKNQTLFLQISSAACRQELIVHKAQIIATLNRAAGGQVIADIRFNG